MSRMKLPCPQGATRLFGVIGDPIAQVKAPELMNRVFVENRYDAVLVPLHVHPADLNWAMTGLKQLANLDGLMVTIPHKFDICAHIDHPSDRVRLSGAANALRRETDGSWSGDNFDGLGFVAGLRQQGQDPAGKRVSLVGTGGAGVAIAAALVEAGIASLTLTDLDREKSRRLARSLSTSGGCEIETSTSPCIADADIVINATPLGLRPEDPLPFDPDRLSPHALVADIIMKPAETALLQTAKARGLAVHPGIHMLATQVEMYREFFRVPTI